ncbi:CpsD/CapB family tyrosine-protein kinase [Salipaludibacillus aurantiacus]|uniref:non-specific protein-tyrosine kinase n=1 Tax=Salipaludibacillus aurantiacus TaxID=1601833 RepID=A0A1H9TQ53_9BACI|nr:CpsD/CapB family tyrosine-protein kinase [Salipaludibacillus aurantiacus]SER99245.1 capsular exopolysaccharide family [Salipaludibacillus aurantiacus]
MGNRALRKKVAYFCQNPDSVMSSKFKRIKLNVEFASQENNCKTLAVTSPGKGEGKSMVVSQLAVSFAREGKKVLLIDSAVNAPVIHHIFKMKNGKGLTNVLAGQVKLREVINQSSVDGLKIVTSGEVTYNAEKLYQSKVMNKLLAEAANEFDYVLLDTPGVHEGTFTKILAGKCDGSILVVRSNKTEDHAALDAKKALEIAKGNVIGVIMNAKPNSFSQLIKNT